MTAPIDVQTLTPMMQQWHQCKRMAKDAVLLFRMGDFYEAFYDDASTLASELQLTLTKRQGIPMAGVPFHAAEGYIDKLVAKGYRVALAEQMEDPKKTKGLVRREVTRVVTPGTVVSSALLQDKANNFCCAIHQVGNVTAIATIDITTGDFRVMELEDGVLDELSRLRPSELVVSDKHQAKNPELIDEMKRSGCSISSIDEWRFEHSTTQPFLIDHFRVHSLDGYGLKGMVAAINAAGALLAYLQEQLCLPIEHIRDLRTYQTSGHMTLDRVTQRNLELTTSLQDGSRRNTLLELMDRTQTPMGGRLLCQWIKTPLLELQTISARQDGIEELLSDRSRLDDISSHLTHIRDLERLMMKVTTKHAGPRDLSTLHGSLTQIAPLKEHMSCLTSKLLVEQREAILDPTELSTLLGRALTDEPPLRVSDGGIFREGHHAELDELAALRRGSKEWLADYQTKIREETGIKTVKVGYTRVFGYYIEVSRGQSDRMPDTYTRRQTLTNAERFISPELKEFEQKVLTAEDRIATLEAELFAELREETAKHATTVLSTAKALAQIDCLLSLALLAHENGYKRPDVHEGDELHIVGGRHPVIEASLLGEAFVPNDTHLDGQDNQLMLITGPNMAGKSTYIRQVALLSIMAQIGSFLPVQSARMGLIDKVFTRIGASDDLSRGQSTFMVEMTETANILNNATNRSLVILDEIGRGTSTYDGVSIAWAVAEYLLTYEGVKAKTLFATHYFELTQLEGLHNGAKNYNVAVQECEDEVIFLRKIVKGDTDKSYGIHVARLAGLPQVVIQRSQEILTGLQGDRPSQDRRLVGTKVRGSKNEVQLLLFEPKKKAEPTAPILKELRALDLNQLTPLEALASLARWQKTLT